MKQKRPGQKQKMQKPADGNIRGLKSLKLWMAGILFFFGIVYAGLLLAFQGKIEETDIVEINKIYQEVLRSWENIESLKEFQAAYAFRVVDKEGKELYHYGEGAPRTVYEAVGRNEAYFLVSKEGRETGAVLIATGLRKLAEKREEGLKASLFILFLLTAGLLFFYFFYLNWHILRPFQKLEEFARNIAAGNLDVPLSMDKKNIFGAFTQSFDIMREELIAAKKKEAAAAREKKELVAALSHDIKTPVTAIKLISELLLVQIKDKNYQKKIASVYEKAEQINHLITDLFQSTLEELGELKTETTEVYSTKLWELFRAADYAEKITIQEIPECLIRADLGRLSQVIGNIVYNSYKYAGTEITVSFQQIPKYLKVIIRDFGTGVLEEEQPYLFQKFYRGKEEFVQKQNGAGLGLYIAKNLMLKMEGDIFCQNVENGFEVCLLISVC